MTDSPAFPAHDLDVDDDYIAWLDAERLRNASAFCNGCGERITADYPADLDYWGRQHCSLCAYPGVRTDVEWHAFVSTVPRFNLAVMGHEQLYVHLQHDPELPPSFARSVALRIDSVISPF
jgi:hypothetical protein